MARVPSFVYPDTFPNRLAAAMGRMNNTELAEKAGASAEMIRRYLLGAAHPRLDRLRRLAEALDVDLEWLRDGDRTGEAEKYGTLFASTSPNPQSVSKQDDVAIFLVSVFNDSSQPMENRLEAAKVFVQNKAAEIQLHTPFPAPYQDPAANAVQTASARKSRHTR